MKLSLNVSTILCGILMAVCGSAVAMSSVQEQAMVARLQSMSKEELRDVVMQKYGEDMQRAVVAADRDLYRIVMDIAIGALLADKVSGSLAMKVVAGIVGLRLCADLLNLVGNVKMTAEIAKAQEQEYRQLIAFRAMLAAQKQHDDVSQEDGLAEEEKA